jgi:hypothetical protein
VVAAIDLLGYDPVLPPIKNLPSSIDDGKAEAALIGVANRPLQGEAELDRYKRSILFYDHILLLHSSEMLDSGQSDPFPNGVFRRRANELEFLLESPYFLPGDKMAGIPVQGSAAETLHTALSEVLAQKAHILTLEPSDANVERAVKLHALSMSLETRLVAECLTQHGEYAVSSFTIPSAFSLPLSTKLHVGDAIELAIDQVMIPDETTAWENVFELKADKDLQDRARKLRLWAVKAARSEESVHILAEQIADLKSDYEAFLRIHRVKTSLTTLRAVVTGFAGAVEDVLKFRLEKLAARFFSAALIKADMTMAEMKAPGRELSLVTVLNERMR